MIGKRWPNSAVLSRRRGRSHRRAGGLRRCRPTRDWPPCFWRRRAGASCGRVPWRRRFSPIAIPSEPAGTRGVVPAINSRPSPAAICLIGCLRSSTFMRLETKQVCRGCPHSIPGRPGACSGRRSSSIASPPVVPANGRRMFRAAFGRPWSSPSPIGSADSGLVQPTGAGWSAAAAFGSIVAAASAMRAGSSQLTSMMPQVR